MEQVVSVESLDPPLLLRSLTAHVTLWNAVARDAVSEHDEADVRTGSDPPRPPNQTLSRLTELMHEALRQLDDIIDVWLQLTDILDERAELVGRGSSVALVTGQPDPDTRGEVADIVRTLERQLARLRLSEARFKRADSRTPRRATVDSPKVTTQ